MTMQLVFAMLVVSLGIPRMAEGWLHEGRAEELLKGVEESAGKVEELLEWTKREQAHRPLQDSGPLADCMDNFQEAQELLAKVLAVLRSTNNAPSALSVDDVRTWLSAVITDEETCVDSFADVAGGGDGDGDGDANNVAPSPLAADVRPRVAAAERPVKDVLALLNAP